MNTQQSESKVNFVTPRDNRLIARAREFALSMVARGWSIESAVRGTHHAVYGLISYNEFFSQVQNEIHILSRQNF